MSCDPTSESTPSDPGRSPITISFEALTTPPFVILRLPYPASPTTSLPPDTNHDPGPVTATYALEPATFPMTLSAPLTTEPRMFNVPPLIVSPPPPVIVPDKVNKPL